MYIPLQWLIIGPVILSLVVGFYVVSIFRNFFQKRSFYRMRYEVKLRLQRQEIEEKRLAVEKLIYSYHHTGLNPKCKTLRGAIDIIRQLVRSIKTCAELLGKPQLMTGYVVEIETWLDRADTICKEMEKHIIDAADEFNHLQ